MFLIEFKGQTCAEYKILPIRRPDMPVPKKKGKMISVPGMDGALIETDGTYEPIEITIPFNFMADPDMWAEIHRVAKQWLSGSGKLVFSDDRNFFYKVLDCEIKNTERKSWRIGTFDVIFTCDPFNYLQAGQSEMDAGDAEYNPYVLAKPIYKITGNGSCVLTVNGKTMEATVGQNLTIDTGRMLAYRSDSGDLMNTSVKGDYEDLYLHPGDNTIEITSGFTLKVIPNWRCL